MKYLKITFSISCSDELREVARELLVDLAAESGCEAFDEEDNELAAYVQPVSFDEAMLKEGVQNFILPDVKITYKVERTEDRNWNEEWERKGFDPIVIENKLIVFDYKQTQAYGIDKEDNIIKIAIETKNAFGTGTHQTTRMILEWMLDANMQNKEVLDCGSGTGILSIMASKLGARAVCAYDIDEWSVENTKYNVSLNHIENITVLQGDANIIECYNKNFDVIIANINRNILISDLPIFSKYLNPGGKIVLSGFYAEDIPLISQKAQELTLRIIEKKEKDNWACIILT